MNIVRLIFIFQFISEVVNVELHFYKLLFWKELKDKKRPKQLRIINPLIHYLNEQK